MKAKEWIKENIDFRREETEVRSNKGYCATMAAAGLAVGVVTGIIFIILQFAISNYEALQRWTNIIAGIALLALIAFLVYMLLPLFKDASLTMGAKMLTALLSVACLIVPFIIGVYLVMLIFMALAALAALWLALKIWGSSSSSSSSYKPPVHEGNGPKSYKLDDGTIVTENSFTSGYHGNDGHDYERNIDDTFSRAD